MLEGKTQSGFAFQIDEELLDDFEFFENLVGLDKGDPVAIMATVDTLLGAEQKQRLKDHLKQRDGRAKMSTFMAELTEMIQSAKKAKNS